MNFVPLKFLSCLALMMVCCHGDLTLNAVVLSRNPNRFNATLKVLKTCGFDSIQRKHPIIYTSPVIDMKYKLLRNTSDPLEKLETDKMKKWFSNKLSFIEAIENFRDEPYQVSSDDDWRFFFEDDIASHDSIVVPNYPQAIWNATRLAKQDGILYLGICAPSFIGEIHPHDFIESQKAFGYCTHSWGLVKWKAQSFLDRIDEISHKWNNGLDQIIMDKIFYLSGKHYGPILVAGSNLTITRYLIHGRRYDSGLFFQNWEFKSEIDK
eukprot:gene17486-24207_t